MAEERTKDQLELGTAEHSWLVEMVQAGHALVGVDPVVARRLLTDSSSADLRISIGELLSFERTIVKLFFFLSWTLLFVSMGFAVKVFGWWSALVIPICHAIWTSLLGRASMGDQRLWPTLSFLVLSIAACFMSDPDLSFQIWLVLVAAACFLIKATYSAATKFIRDLVLRNYRAFNLLDGRGIQVIVAEEPE